MAIAALLAFAVSAVTPRSAEAATSGAYTYEVNSGVATITKCTASGNVSVPQTLNGYVVVGIGPQAFEGNTRITGVTFPSTLKEISWCAFKGCTGLRSLTLPANLTTVRWSAFESTTSLTAVNLNSTDITSFDESAFKNAGIGGAGITVTCGSSCRAVPSRFMDNAGAKVVKVVFSSSVSMVGWGAFCNCDELSSVTLGSGVKTIDSYAFAGCVRLTGVAFPSTLKEIGYYTFEGCTGLRSITLPASVSSFGRECFYGLANRSTIYVPTKAQYDTLLNDYYDYYDPSSTKLVYRPTNLSEASLSKVSAKTYTGKAISPNVTVKMAGKALRKNVDYTIGYSNNKKIGTAAVTIKGKGAYSGARTVKFKINPKGTSISRLKGGNDKFTAKWKKVPGVTGYQVRYSTLKNMKYGTTKTIKKASSQTKKLTHRVWSKTKVYVQVRTYKKVSGKTYYSGWSKKKAVWVK